MLTVHGVDNFERGLKMDPTKDWIAVTHQIRMYAASSNIQDVLVMDETAGIYFCFPCNPSDHEIQHDYLYASTDLGTHFGVKPRLSMRELVVYFLLSALERSEIEIRDFEAEGASLIPVPANRPYRNVFSGLAPPPPESSKHTRSATELER